MGKLSAAIMGKKGRNLDDLKFMTGKFKLPVIELQLILILEFCHTGDLESLNALLLKYAKKTHAFRYVAINSNLAQSYHLSPL